LKKVLSIFLLVVFLIGNVGLTLANHYCGGKISEQSLMLIEHDFGCKMNTVEEVDKDVSSCPMHQKHQEDTTKNNLKADNCCDNQFTELKVRDGFQSENNEIKINSEFLFAWVAVITQFNFNEHVSPVTYYDISPPLPTADIYIQVQSFLI
jgi:hypothetical protein